MNIRSLFISISMVLALAVGSTAQEIVRDIEVAAGSNLNLSNPSGRIDLRVSGSALASSGDHLVAVRVTASSDTPVEAGELSVSRSGKAASIAVTTKGKKRIDLAITISGELELELASSAGQITVDGDLHNITARTDTGTILVNVPPDLIEYRLSWLEARPRVVADFGLNKVSERSAGRFEIKGKYAGTASEPVSDVFDNTSAKSRRLAARQLDLTTSRGVILLNVSASEVGSDLRERPLTEAAKAIVRSGDSLLMDAIRRTAPKYFGDYLRTLPPIKRQPVLQESNEEQVRESEGRSVATVRVSDLSNRAILGLSSSDFEVFENGQRREILRTSRSSAPYDLVLLLDISGSVTNYETFIRKIARSFVESTNPDDRVAIIVFNDDVKVLSPFTTDRTTLSASLDEFEAGGGTAYYDALAYVLSDTLRTVKNDRTAIVVVTDGEDNRSFLSFDSLTGSVQESGTLIYPIYVPNGLIPNANAGTTDLDPVRKKYMSLTSRSQGEGERLAKISGGVYFPIADVGQIQEAYKEIATQLRSSYEIEYRSILPAATKGPSPRLRIRAKTPNSFTTVNSVRREAN